MLFSPRKLLVAMSLAVWTPIVAPAAADVFSSQGFNGEQSTLNALPGVNLDPAPGSSVNGNCVEVEMPAYARDRSGIGGTWTECQVGNFTFSSKGGSSRMMGRDPTYNFQPPPWAEGWRP